VEIGTARGGTLFMLTRVAADDALLLGIDYAEPDANNFGGYADNRRRGHLYRGFPKGDRQRVEFLFANSHERATVDRLEAVLGGRPVDVLFIDGDHTYDGVRSDFEMYAPLVRSGGIIGFHDIVPGAAENVGGVPDFWREIKDASATEFVADWQQGGWGIGVLRRASQ
jgi:predicted O-methyltransferase YrrM